MSTKENTNGETKAPDPVINNSQPNGAENAEQNESEMGTFTVQGANDVGINDQSSITTISEKPNRTPSKQGSKDNLEMRQLKKERNSALRREKRKDPAYKSKERERDAARRREKRKDPVIQAQERDNNTARRREKRLDPAVKAQEVEKNTTSRREKRKDSAITAQEGKINTANRREKRKDPTIKAHEGEQNTASRKEKRKDPTIRAQEGEKNTSSRREKRKDPAVKAQESEKDASSRREKRKDPAVKAKECQKDASSRREKRKDPAVKAKECQKDASSRREKRKHPAVKAKECQKDASSRREKRKDPAIKAQESEKDASSRREKRKNPAIKAQEREKDAASRREKRKDPAIKAQESENDASSRREKRKDPAIKAQESEQNTASRREKRKDDEKRSQENELRTEARANRRKSFGDCLKTFQNAIKSGPTHICSCCGGLFFHKAVTNFPSYKQVNQERQSLSNDDITWNTFLATVDCVEGAKNICRTCRKSVLRMEVPKLAIRNGFKYPEIPPELQNLTQLEERLCAGRLPFMCLRVASHGGQVKLKGNIINVFNPVNETVDKLPRQFSETRTISVALMRRLEYTHPYMHEVIRPRKVYNAAKYLLTTEAYREDGFRLSEDWADIPETETTNFLDSDEINETECESCVSNPEQIPDGEDHTLSEDMGPQETLICSDSNLYGIKIAPGQGQVPFPLHRDERAEILAFPSIFCGEPRKFAVHVTYGDIAKSEARRYDRRGCSPVHLLYAYKLLQTYRIVSAITMSLKKRKVGKITAGDALNKACIENLIKYDDGYQILSCVRSSPAYWSRERKRVMAFIRQKKRLPTFFITLSAAEIYWIDLIVILKEVVDKEIITKEQGACLSWEEKSRLLRADPITAARYFDHKFAEFRKEMLKSGAIFDGYYVNDEYFRVEFQMISLTV